MESDQGANSKLDKIVEVLKAHSLAWVATLTDELLLTHPENRGGTMCNPFDCHFKGEKIVTTGLKPALLPANSVAIEMSQHHSTRQLQLQKNRDLSANSQNMLAPVSGRERYLTLGCSHFVKYCRALQAQALSLPRFCQLSLNSSNTTALASTELQTMLQIAKLLEGGVSLQNALMSVKAGEPACGPYLQDVAHYVRMFGGGSTMPLLRHLHAFSAMATLVFLFQNI